MSFKVISFEQPVGSFLLTIMSHRDLIKIAKADPRKFDKVSLETVGGIEREPSNKRIQEIAEYAGTVDAAFPTPILLALDENSYELDNDELEIKEGCLADIVDGQHRVLGLKEYKGDNEFFIPVVFILDATEEQKALIFAIINGKQTKVPASIIYDLFGVIEAKSPQKVAHEIARALNKLEHSPWYRRLKMLGKKTPGSTESLSQGTFVKFLLPLISDNPMVDMDIIKRKRTPPARPQCIFNKYFIKKEDSVILKILINLFQAVRNTWPREWDNPDISVLTKTTGYTGIMKALPELIKKGESKSNLSVAYFQPVFGKAKEIMNSRDINLDSENFPPSSASENQLKNIIIEALSSIN